MSRRWGGLDDGPTGGGDALLVFAGSAGFRDVAVALRLPLPDEFGTVIPAAQRFVAGLGWRSSGARVGRRVLPAVADWLPRLEIVCLDLGLLLSLYTGCRIAVGRSSRPPGRAFVPWAFLIVLLFATGVWIVLQPMQMRGTMPRMD